MSQMSVPSSAQLVQAPSLAAAQVEANFSDAETSLQLAEVGVLSGVQILGPNCLNCRTDRLPGGFQRFFVSLIPWDGEST